MYVISACLAGRNCKYNGENNKINWVFEISKEKNCILVCPETAGGLPTPRRSAEIQGGRVIDSDGRDVTEDFRKGAAAEVTRIEGEETAFGETVEMAILKSNSPSCGCGKIYNGTFTGTLTDGDGIFAKMLLEKGIKVVTEKEPIVKQEVGENR